MEPQTHPNNITAEFEVSDLTNQRGENCEVWMTEAVYVGGHWILRVPEGNPLAESMDQSGKWGAFANESQNGVCYLQFMDSFDTRDEAVEAILDGMRRTRENRGPLEALARLLGENIHVVRG